MNIVLAIDGSDCSDIACEELARLPIESDSYILIVTILDRSRGVPLELIDKLELWENAEKMVARAAIRLKDRHPDVTISTKVLEGPTKQCLMDFVDRADLLVVGSHGRHGISRFLLGSVSQTLLHYVSCPMLIIKRESDESRNYRVLVALDDSVHSRNALDKILATKLPERTTFRFATVVEGIPQSWWFDLAPEEERAFMTKFHEKQKEKAERFLAGIEEVVNEKMEANRIKFHVLEGDVKEKLLAAAQRWGSDLIVMGSHGTGYHDRFELGSVSETVSQHSPCSVLVIR